LANLIQTGGNSNQVPKAGLKNWSSDAVAAIKKSSSGNLASLANARRLASAGRMDSLIRSLSGSGKGFGNSENGNSKPGSNANFNVLQSIQGLSNNSSSNLSNIQRLGSSGSILGNGNPYSNAALSLANMLRVDSSTGLTALRMQNGLAQRNSSVDDFLSLVSNGDIPHQDPHMLNIPLQSVMHQQNGNQTGAQAAATYLAHQQLLAQAGNRPLANLAAKMGMNSTSAASLRNQLAQGSSSHSNNNMSAGNQHQQRTAQMNLSASAIAAARAQVQQQQGLKRKLEENGSNEGATSFK